jgi:hypothetical protein
VRPLRERRLKRRVASACHGRKKERSRKEDARHEHDDPTASVRASVAGERPHRTRRDPAGTLAVAVLVFALIVALVVVALVVACLVVGLRAGRLLTDLGRGVLDLVRGLLLIVFTLLTLIGASRGRRRKPPPAPANSRNTRVGKPWSQPARDAALSGWRTRRDMGGTEGVG